MSLRCDPHPAPGPVHDRPGSPASPAPPGEASLLVIAGSAEEGAVIAHTLAACPTFAAARIIAAPGDMPAFPAVAPGAQVRLLGFGGGAAAVLQWALLHPRRVARLCLVSADRYCLPRPELAWPLGMAGAPADWAAFLAIPATVIVGNRDTRSDPALTADPLITEHQGRNRLRRARIFHRDVIAYAASLGRPCALTLHAVHGISADFGRSVAEGDLLARAHRALLME